MDGAVVMEHISQALIEFIRPWLEVMPPILLLGLALLLAAALGESAARLKLPRVLGYWFTGVICYGALSLIFSDVNRSTVFGMNLPTLTPHAYVQQGRAVFELALGFVLVELGRRVQLQWLLTNRGLLITSLLESSLSFAAVGGVLIWWGYSLWTCLLLAAVFIATSPVLIAAVIAQCRAEGQISERAMHLSAVNTMIAAVLTSGLLTVANSARDQLDWASWLMPVFTLVIAAMIGTVAGQLLRWLLRLGAQWSAADGVQGAAGASGASSAAHAWAYGWQVFIGVVLAALGAAQWLDAPILVTSMVLGITATHGSRMLRFDERRQPRTPAPPVPYRGVPWPNTAPLVPLVSAGLMVYVAAALPFSEWWALLQTGRDRSFTAVLSVALLLIAARGLAKFVSVSLAAPWAKIKRSQVLGLALALQSVAAIGVSLLMKVQTGYAPLQTQAALAAWLAIGLLDALSGLILLLIFSYSKESMLATNDDLVPVSKKIEPATETFAKQV